MKLDLPDQQIAQVLNILAQRPYAEVYEIINMIQVQAANQPPRTGPQLVPEAPASAAAA